MKQILVIFGGCSSEHDVSLESAHAVLSHMDTTQFMPIAVGITRDGSWLYFNGSWSDLKNGCWESKGVHCTLNLNCGSQELLLLDGTGKSLCIDAVFPVLHGKNGEDGTLQGLFELIGIPIIGCGTLASALCMDKVRAHQLIESISIRVPKNYSFNSSASMDEIQAAVNKLGFPLFVKPVRAGSSFGVSRVEEAENLANSIENAFQYDSAILLEEAIDGFEVGCAVMGNQELTTGLIDEIELADGFFDYTEKYTLKTSFIHCPARISPEKTAEIRQTAKQIYRALGCRIMARVDLFLTQKGEIVFNEVNTIPGFTSHSRFPTMMRGIGLDFQELLTRLIELGVQS